MQYTAAVITVSDKCSRGERVDTSLKLFLIALQRHFEVGSERHVAESGAENGFRLVLRVCHHGIRALVDVSEKSGVKQCVEHSIRICLGEIDSPEVLCFLLLVSLHLNAQNLSSVTSLHGNNLAADRRSELHFRMQLVHIQSIPGQNSFPFLDHHFRLDSHKCIRHDTVHF